MDLWDEEQRPVSIGYVTGLDYKDPMIDPHAEFQKFKTHPTVAAILDGRQDDQIRRQIDQHRRVLHDAETLC